MTKRDAMTRRRFVQSATASSLAFGGLTIADRSLAQSARPNIVFILADDLGYADVSCYGQRDYTTPNIDRLAIEGLKIHAGVLQFAGLLCDAHGVDHWALSGSLTGWARRAD